MAEIAKSTREPKASDFTQQRLTAVRPILTPFQVILAYLTLGLLLIPIGVVCLHASQQVQELRFRYDNHEDCRKRKSDSEWIREMQDGSEERNCTFRMTIESSMSSPVYVYYELDNYFQNHRRYVKSRSDEQLAGESGGDKSDCKPKLYQRSDNNGKEFNESAVIKPCGLTAWSFFNDTIKIQRDGGSSIKMRERGIAWESDIKYKFGNYVPENFNNNPDYRGGGIVDESVSENEHFIVWMRTASLPKFRKLYGIIDHDLEKDSTLSVTINNLYNTYLFGGTKSIVLSTTSWLGGQNAFLGITFVITGCISLFVGCLYFAFHMQFPRRLGDERFLSWKRKRY